MPGKEQNFWNFCATVLFIALVAAAVYSLWAVGSLPVSITVFDFILLSLATFRLTRLFVYDHVTQFIRDLFCDVTYTEHGVERQKAPQGVRRTVADLLHCPWCLGVWAALLLTFFYYLTPYAWLPILLFAVAGVGTFLQLSANLVGHSAELKKVQVAKEKAEEEYTH